MGKNSGGTRSGSSNNPAGNGNAGASGQRMNNFADFRSSERLNGLLDRVENLAKSMDGGKDTPDKINATFEDGLKALNEYERAARIASGGLRQGRSLAEDMLDSNVERLRKLLMDTHTKESMKAARSEDIGFPQLNIDRLINGAPSISSDASVGELRNYRANIRSLMRQVRNVKVASQEDREYQNEVVQDLNRRIERATSSIERKTFEERRRKKRR